MSKSIGKIMKIRIILLIFIILFLTPFLVSCQKGKDPISEGQQKWAEEHGVNIEDYSYPSVFPVYYFDSILKPGDSLDKTCY